MTFWNTLLWETVQNAPLVVGTVLSARTDGWLHYIVGVLGAVTGALAIHVTEPRLTGKAEEWTTTGVNATTMAIAMTVAVAYLSVGCMVTDLLLGALLGMILAAAQAIAQGGGIGKHFKHVAALGTAAAIGLAAIRFVSLSPPAIALVGSVVITVSISAVVVFIDY